MEGGRGEVHRVSGMVREETALESVAYSRVPYIPATAASFSTWTIYVKVAIAIFSSTAFHTDQNIQRHPSGLTSKRCSHA